MNPLNKYFDNIYLLYISQKEINKVKHKLYKHNIKVQYFKGVNGKKELYEKYKSFPNKKKIPSIGAFGHLYSFISILKDAIYNNYNKILILEADIYFCKNFDKLVTKYLKMDYKLLHLGASQHIWDDIEIKDGWYYSSLTCGTFAIGLDKGIFEEYLNLLLKLEKPSDLCLFNIYKKHPNKCIVTYPNLISCDVSDSSIGSKRDQLQYINKFRWNRDYEYDDVFTFNCEIDKWYQVYVLISNHFGYRTGNLKIKDSYDNIVFPNVELPNVLLNYDKIKINTVKDLEKISNSRFYIRTKSEKIVFEFSNIFIQNIKLVQVNRDIVYDKINLWQLRKDFDLSLIDYYQKNLNLTIDKIFINRFNSDKELFLNPTFFNEFIKNLKIDLPEKNIKNNKINVMYLINYSPQYESIGYTIRTHNLIKNTINEFIDITGVSRYGYPYDKKKEYYEHCEDNFSLDNIKYDKLKDGNDNRNNYNLTDYLKKYIIETIKYAWINNINIIHAASDYWNGIAALYASKYLGIKSIYEVRGLWEESTVTFKPHLFKSDMLKMRSTMELLVCKNVNQVITINDNLKKELIDKGVKENNIKVLVNGVDTDTFKPNFPTSTMIKLKIPKNKYNLIIGYIGSIIDYEGLEYIVRSLKILKNSNIKCKLILVGGGNKLKELMDLAKTLGVKDDIMYLGKKPHKEIIELYNVFDLVIYPRKNLQVCRSTSSSKVYEAMSMQKCIIVSDLPAWREVIEEGKTGLYFEPDNVKDLIEKIKLVINNKQKRNNLGKRARVWVIKNRSWKSISLNLKEIYINLLDY